MPPTVAIVGRPNVGKSTLFNRLVRGGRALVDPAPGVTRDRIEGEGRLGDLTFRLIDTAGLDEGPRESVPWRLRQQTERALQQADAALLLIDAKAGLTALDREVAGWLRRHAAEVVLVANKCEGMAAEALASEAWGLGLGPPVPVSAQNREGFQLLAEALEDALERARGPAATDDDIGERPDEDRSLKLAVAGRPNVGKSSLINRLIEDDRLLTGPEPGLTRDAVTIAWSFKDRRVELIDTAGLRRKSRVEGGGLEHQAGRATVEAIRDADVTLLVVDAANPLEKQDLVIANRAIDHGRALIVAVNKWDLVDDPGVLAREVRRLIDLRLPQVRGLSWIPVSALTGRNVAKLLEAAVDAFERWSTRVPTAALNRWLEEMVGAHPPPLVRGRRLKIRYITQANARPPTFIAFLSQATDLPEAYRRYLINGLRSAFDLDGVPIRIRSRAGRNPYA
ncbi:MAG: ribosome biogenesis GTPase Der [Geminicoccaceae bacterium]|nr:ribosome biogenesis GTPase Der [Geminicoccaceae bacterium]